jgi:hypothetical protein
LCAEPARSAWSAASSVHLPTQRGQSVVGVGEEVVVGVDDRHRRLEGGFGRHAAPAHRPESPTSMRGADEWSLTA